MANWAAHPPAGVCGFPLSVASVAERIGAPERSLAAHVGRSAGVDVHDDALPLNALRKVGPGSDRRHDRE